MEKETNLTVERKHSGAAASEVLDLRTPLAGRRSAPSIDGIFRSRTQIVPTAKTAPVITEAITKSDIDAASEPPSRGVNHTKARKLQPGRTKAINVHHTVPTTAPIVVNRQPAQHIHHHATQHSQTLKREAVKRPAPSLHNRLKPQGALAHTTPSVIALKNHADAIDGDRLARAQLTQRHPAVAHHAQPQSSVVPIFAPLQVATAPGNPGNEPPVTPPPQQGNEPEEGDIFTKALATANHFVDVRTHRAQFKKKKQTHIATMLAGSLALIIIASFVAYQNSPALQLQVASMQSGIAASLPNFKAAGFQYNGVRANNNSVTVGFKNSSGNYQLTQTSTNFSDADMIQSIGSTTASGNPAYSVILAGNTVVYRFSNINATWVANGKWYTVTGNSALSDNQVKALVHEV